MQRNWIGKVGAGDGEGDRGKALEGCLGQGQEHAAQLDWEERGAERDMRWRMGVKPEGGLGCGDGVGGVGLGQGQGQPYQSPTIQVLLAS